MAEPAEIAMPPDGFGWLSHLIYAKHPELVGELAEPAEMAEPRRGRSSTQGDGRMGMTFFYPSCRA